MYSLAAHPPLVRGGVRLLWTVAGTGLIISTVAAAGGPGDPRDSGHVALYLALFLIAGALCLLRAALIPGQRLTWSAFGIGMWCWAGGAIYWIAFLDGTQNPPYPSWSDALYLGYYVFALAGLLILMRSGLARLHRRAVIDVAGGALAIATIGAVLLSAPIVEVTAQGADSVAMNLVYPLIDVLIVSLIFAVFVIHGWHPGRVWGVLAGIWTLQAIGDTAYLRQVAEGTYMVGGLIDAWWPPLMLAIAVAAWLRPPPAPREWVQGFGTLAVTVAVAVVGLLALVIDQLHEIGLVASILALLTVTFGFVRAAMSFAERQSLARGSELSLQRTLILDSAGEGIAGTDADGRITFMNPAGKRMTGYEPGELTGRSLHATLHHTKADGSPYPVEDCPVHASLLDGAIHHCDQDVYWCKNGSSFPVEYTSTPIVQDAHIRGAVVVFRDVTERRQMERIKDEFTSVVSHELRTPLTSIRGSLGLLESGAVGPLPTRAERMIQIAVQNTDRLVRLINDILDLERLDSEALSLRTTTCDAEQLIARVTEGMLPAAVAADVTLAVDTTPAAFEADADRIIQTLTNLISNAVKFSPPGSTVQISSQRRSDDILFTVRDEGRGVPADKLESIFGRFQQVDSSDSRRSGGTGLGLAICRSIVELHGGRIWAHSVPGDGSTFSFVVPAAPGPIYEYEPRAGGARGSVLLCDDDVQIIEVTGTLLEEHGYHVIVALTGQQAVQRAIAERPDVIVLDLQMPGTNGAETAVALREHTETSAIPVVVLSVLPHSEQEMSTLGFVDWIEKPAAPERLFAALERAIGVTDMTFRVVVIERDRAVSEILRALFARHGVTSFAALSGQQALHLSAAHHPDLLVLNDDLPDVAGVEARSWIRGQEGLGALPVVSYASGDVADAERERQSVGAVAQILARGQMTVEEFQWRVMTLLARPHVRRRTP